MPEIGAPTPVSGSDSMLRCEGPARDGGAEIVVSASRARQAVTGMHVRYVLAISLALAIAALVAVPFI